MTETAKTAGPSTARSLHEICESARQQPAATAALCRTSRIRSVPVIVMRTANAVGLYGPPGFKSPILRLLSSGSTRRFAPGVPLLSAFRTPCVAIAWPSRPSGPFCFICHPRHRAGLSHARIPGGLLPVTMTAGRGVHAPRPASDHSRQHERGTS
jgi:hypothetical protein